MKPPYSATRVRLAHHRWHAWIALTRAERLARHPVKWSDLCWPEMQREMLDAFEAATGWRRATPGGYMTLRQVATGRRLNPFRTPYELQWPHDLVDHAKWFNGRRRPIACVTNNYREFADVHRDALARGLRATLLRPEWNWYFPGRGGTNPIALTALGNDEALHALRHVSIDTRGMFP